MPLPITPTQLTVLTRASAFAESKFPWTSSSIKVVGLDFDFGCLTKVPKLLANFSNCGRLVNANSEDARPRDEVMYQKLRLSPSRPVRIVGRVVPVPKPHDLPVNFTQVSQVVVKLR